MPPRPMLSDSWIVAVLLYVAVGVPVLGLWGSLLGEECLLFVGVYQLTFVLPLTLWAWSKKRFTMVKMFAILASIIILLNAACWGLIAAMMRPALR